MGAVERRALVVRGTVQGVGFRPFVHNLALHHGLSGFVRNSGREVAIEIEGEPEPIERFLSALRDEPPPLARIEAVEQEPCAPAGDRGFGVRASRAKALTTSAIAPDAATCAACAQELLDPTDRRFGHPFIACSDCGPRLTTLLSLPYDRAATTMGAFLPCADCEREYGAAADRRFHAQGLACHACGPRLQLFDERGARLGSDPIAGAAQALIGGLIVAIKGVGGYHLACDASDPAAVARLRERKRRERKPLAIMVQDLAAAEALAELEPAERQVLTSVARPIVLVRPLEECPLAREIAGELDTLGLMLPYTPLHLLLMRAVGARPLVMTSGNLAGGAIAVDDASARARLCSIADRILVHDRVIALACEDSVVRVVEGRPLPIRRSRGESPQPLPLPARLPRPALAVGGALKAVFGIGVEARAVLSPHFGDLEDEGSSRAWRRAIEHFESLLGVRPATIVCDLHPDYESTRYALERALAGGPECSLRFVQHHHAHMAACMAEHGLEGEVIGVCFDGSGLGDDGTLWGGEFLVGGYTGFTRAGQLAASALPGGERAVHEPWRLTLAQLLGAGLSFDEACVPAPGPRELAAVRQLIERGVACTATSSVGRLFDAVAAFVLGEGRADYEADLACRLEALASRSTDAGRYPVEVDSAQGGYRLDVRPLWAELLRDRERAVAPADMARRFHLGLADAAARMCCRLRDDAGLARVTLSGGAFCNALLTRALSAALRAEGFCVYRHERVPPNDGGLALGQLAVLAGGGARPMQGAV